MSYHQWNDARVGGKAVRRQRKIQHRQTPDEQQGAMSPMWINSRIVQAAHDGHSSLLATIEMYLPMMTIVNHSTAMHRLAKIAANNISLQRGLKSNPIMRELVGALALLLAQHSACPDGALPQSLSNIVWAFATMKIVDDRVLQHLGELAMRNIASFKDFELSTMLWALAKISTFHNVSSVIKPVFESAAGSLMRGLKQVGFRCLATISWAFATAQQQHAGFFRNIAAQMVGIMDTANCQELANSAWAFGKLGFHDDKLFRALAQRSLCQFDQLKPQELSNMFWGFANNGFFHGQFYERGALAAQQMDLQPQHLANILWAFARVRSQHAMTQETIVALLPACIRLLESFKPQEVSSTLLAVAKGFAPCEDLGHRCGRSLQTETQLPDVVTAFFDVAVPWVARSVDKFTAQSLANTLTACSMLLYPAYSSLLDVVTQQVHKNFGSFKLMELIHLLKAFLPTPANGTKSVSRTNTISLLATGVLCHFNALSSQEKQMLSSMFMEVSRQPRAPLNASELRERLTWLVITEVSDAGMELRTTFAPGYEPLPELDILMFPPAERQFGETGSPTQTVSLEATIEIGIDSLRLQRQQTPEFFPHYTAPSRGAHDMVLDISQAEEVPPPQAAHPPSEAGSQPSMTWLPQKHCCVSIKNTFLHFEMDSTEDGSGADNNSDISDEGSSTVIGGGTGPTSHRSCSVPIRRAVAERRPDVEKALCSFGVLIVEEDQFHRTCLRNLLKLLGVPLAHVHEAKSCDEALACFAGARRKIGYVMIGRRVRGAATSQECAERLAELAGNDLPPVDLIVRTSAVSATPFGCTLKMPVGLHQLSERLHVASSLFL